MELKDPGAELLTSLEQMIFKDMPQANLANRNSIFSEYEQLRQGTGLQLDEFASAMGVTRAHVLEWEERRTQPSTTELKLMRLIQAKKPLLQ
ncbi:HTH-type transcriptional regulator [Mangrovibacter plantisponsor]|uniref:Putative transcriptional regulator n=1 Tax=Mangrovibacter plantisponsor TaxID=451513 RepID=A0A317PV51_9ENTR|nr:HTH-type transcriptional regulator [Mangrovibacter plantisponsor]PWW06634.1 putative transcriptional regulator [Mangrovibacter plantisponsor]